MICVCLDDKGTEPKINFCVTRIKTAQSSVIPFSEALNFNHHAGKYISKYKRQIVTYEAWEDMLMSRNGFSRGSLFTKFYGLSYTICTSQKITVFHDWDEVAAVQISLAHTLKRNPFWKKKIVAPSPKLFRETWILLTKKRAGNITSQWAQMPGLTSPSLHGDNPLQHYWVFQASSLLQLSLGKRHKTNETDLWKNAVALTYWRSKSELSL